MKRRVATFLCAAAGVLSTASCAGLDFLSSRCDVEVIAVTWPVQIRRDGSTTTATLASSASRRDLGSPAFDQMRAALVDGTLAQDIWVTWNVPAFGGTGAVALTHRVVLGPTGATAVHDAGELAGWGLSSDRGIAAAAVRTASAASVTGGSIQQLGSAPSRYRVSLEARESGGASLQITGDVSFASRMERRACF